MDDIYQKIYDHELLNGTIDNLTLNRFAHDHVSFQQEQLTTENIRKCVWFASLLAMSENEDHRQKAQNFASLLYLKFPENIDIQKVAYIIYSRAGNLTATRFLKDIGERTKAGFEFKDSFGYLLDGELSLERLEKSLRVEEEELLLTDFQFDLWQNLNTKDDLAISAPTSSGKSFIIQQYINHKFRAETKVRILYIVSSRALLSQVSELFRSILPEDVQINTSFVFENNEIVGDIPKHLLILTPERCLRLLQSAWKQIFPLDILFTDEIQNIEETEGRGVLLEYVLNEINEAWPELKKIIAGPLLKNSRSIFYDLFQQLCVSQTSNKSPVFQIKTIVRPYEIGKIGIKILSKDNPEQEERVMEVPFDLRALFGKSIGKGMAKIVSLFASNSLSIVYSPKTNLVQAWAREYAAEVPFIAVDSRVRELIDFLADEVHPRYFLIECLKKGVAFHHAKLPDIVRKEIEDLFSDGKLSCLFCTSTLLEGVNLPANNLFVVSPVKRTEPLTPFEFGNLIGRAGRIRDSLYGTIYCIEKDNNKWAQKYYDTNFNKEVVSSNKQALEKATDVIREMSQIAGQIKEGRIRNAVISLRHKFLKDPISFAKYLDTKVIHSDERVQILAGIETSMADNIVPYEILRLNPSIDPLMQAKLFNLLQKDGVDAWIFHDHPSFFARVKRENNEKVPYEKKSFFWQLFELLTKLDEIFEITREAYFKYAINVSVAQMCSYACQWLDNQSYKELILADIRFHSRHTNPKKKIDPSNPIIINHRINEVIKIHSTISTFILVKYLKLLNDLLLPFMGENPEEKFRFSLSMPVKLELGTSKGSAIHLMSRGVNRSVALKVVKEFEKINGFKDMDIFQWLKSVETLPLKAIYIRYLQKLNLLKRSNPVA